MLHNFLNSKHIFWLRLGRAKLSVPSVVTLIQKIAFCTYEQFVGNGQDLPRPETGGLGQLGPVPCSGVILSDHVLAPTVRMHPADPWLHHGVRRALGPEHGPPLDVS